MELNFYLSRLAPHSESLEGTLFCLLYFREKETGSSLMAPAHLCSSGGEMTRLVGNH